MKEIYINPVYKMDIACVEEQFEQVSFDCGSSILCGDGLSSSEALSLSSGETKEMGGSHEEHDEEDGTSSTVSGDGSFPWAPNISKYPLAEPASTNLSKQTWEPTIKIELSEIEMMKEKFSKLLLGEDMSGGAKGVCSALAISNAITNLSASVFGELWRLEPLPEERKALWRREMDWLLSVTDHIVELVPSWQTLPDGSKFEVMITSVRSDIHVNLPALRKLDAMLLESLSSFRETEFWYVDQGIMMAEEGPRGVRNAPLQRQEEKWWLPSPKVPVSGLSEEGKKRLQNQRESINQILKAAVAINTQVLSEMEIPDAYWDALPKSGKASLGEVLYRLLSSEYFYAESLLSALNLSDEHKAVDLANRIEAAIHVWRRRWHTRGTIKASATDLKQNSKNSWGLKDMMDRRERLAGRAESVLVCLRHKFPNLRQCFLDTTKIQHNRDVGQSILESYSRVLESLAFNILSRIEDVLYVDDTSKRALPPAPPAVKTRILSQRRGYSLNHSVHTPYVTPLATPSNSPTPSPSPRRTPNSPFYPGHGSQSSCEDMGYGFEVVSVGDGDDQGDENQLHAEKNG